MTGSIPPEPFREIIASLEGAEVAKVVNIAFLALTGMRLRQTLKDWEFNIDPSLLS